MKERKVKNIIHQNQMLIIVKKGRSSLLVLIFLNRSKAIHDTSSIGNLTEPHYFVEVP
jgi:hypothetical protein